jgi:hypothetical protein
MRTKFAGILQAPPAMVESTFRFVVGVFAARDILDHKKSIQRLSQRKQEIIKGYQDFLHLLDTAENNIQAKIGLRVEHKSYEDIFSHPMFLTFMYTLYQPPTQGVFSKWRQDESALGKLKVMRKRAAEGYDEALDDCDGLIASEEEGIQFAKPYLSPGIKAEDSEAKIPVDLSGWKISGFEDKLDAMRERLIAPVRRNWEKNPDLFNEYGFKQFEDDMQSSWRNIRVEIRDERTSDMASWEELRRTLVIQRHHFLPLEEGRVKKLRMSIRHEMQHAMQSMMSEALKSSAGVPSKSVATPNFIQEGRDPRGIERQKALKKLKSQGVDTHLLSEKDFYYLDDLEYMTQLSDAIAAFERLEEIQVIPDRKSAILRFIGGKGPFDKFTQGSISPNPFFVSLKKHAAAKYREAAREFVKAIL